MPNCVVTHCIFTTEIPEDTFLQENTTDWTPIRFEIESNEVHYSIFQRDKTF